MIELMLVISIIIILCAILLPTLGRVKEVSAKTLCASNMRQTANGLYVYDSDFDRLPALWSELRSSSDGAPGFRLRYADGGAEWLGLGALFRDGYIQNGGVFYCPGKRNRKADGSLSYEGAGASGSFGWNESSSFINNNYWIRWCSYTNSYERAANYIPHMESRIQRNSPDRWLSVDMWGYYVTTPENFWLPHSGGANIAFIDTHTRFIKMSTPPYSVCGGRPCVACPWLIGTFGESFDNP
jgi:prepilin-type processing-associated H-X9-DG protein